MSQPSPIASSRRYLGLDRPLDGPRHGEIALAIGRLDDLRDHLPVSLEGGVHVPARAGPAEARKREILARIAFRDIPGRIDTKHEEGDAARAGPVQAS